MALGHRIIERALDGVAEVVALMGVLGNRPVSLKGIGAYFERRVAYHLSELGLSHDQIAAFFEHRATKTTRAWLAHDDGLVDGEFELIVSRVEQEVAVIESDILRDFVAADAGACTDDQARRRRRRALDILAFLRDAGVVTVSGPEANRVYTAVPVPPHLGLDTTVWLYVYRHGPESTAQLAAALREPTDVIEEALSRLEASGVIERTKNGWESSRVAQEEDTPNDWQASATDHLGAVLSTVSARLRWYLAPGFRKVPRAGTGFDTVEFSLPGRDAEALAGIALEFRERLRSLIQEGSGSPRLRVYLGQSFVETDE